MRTTLLNPTAWLLALTAATALVGSVRGRSARESAASVLRYATMWPVLAVLVVMSAAGIGSRAVLGFLAPGAYAEEVAAARTFLDERALYSEEGRTRVQELVGESSGAALPWAGLPGISGCQANAIENRAKFFTNHAHTPMLLLAGVPIVSIGGSRALYACLLLLSCAAIVGMAASVLTRLDVPWRSRSALLIVAAIAGWQPVLAGVRQGDAVLLAAGLVAAAWYAVNRGVNGRGAFAAACGSCLALPSIGVLPAMMRTAPRAGALALLMFAAAAGATTLVAGPEIVSAFLRTVVETATTYAFAPQNYGVAGRLAVTGAGGPVLLATLGCALLLTWWRARTTDHAFSAFVALGLLAAPVVWSQHLALVFVPAVVLLTGILARGSSASLGGWAFLVLMLSLPDIAVEKLGALIGPGAWGPTFPILPCVLVAFWAWTVFTGTIDRETSLVADRPSLAPL
jgi:hypothetical protein